ncbi:MAG: triose-phosphate isomerase [Firmicutes bacterium]|nr:triose-phosphate isomerase [Bacillota bacterium]
MRYPFIAGNWKMYKTTAEAKAFAQEFKKIYQPSDVKTAIFAPFTQLAVLAEEFKGTGIGLGAQNVHYEREGAFTGEISIPMLQEIGVEYCIVGHSERRQYFNETDDTVNRKAKALLEAGITPVICVGEDLYQREHNYQDKLVAEQVANAMEGIPAEDAAKVVIAYEPIWAIGTGRTATPIQANHMCKVIRDELEEIYDEETADKVVIQYGGSVKPENALEILNMEEIDGALVGGASLEPLKFIEIVNF